MNFSYKREVVECLTEDCKETFLKTGPRHLYCRHCAVDRQKERALRYREGKRK